MFGRKLLKKKVTTGPPLSGHLVFLHLHKTGGSTIHQLLTEHLPIGSMAPKDRSGLVHAEANSVVQPVISGHVTARYIQSLPGTPRVFTVLREPTERLLSMVYFLKGYTHEHLQTYDNPLTLGIKAAKLGDLLRDARLNGFARDYYVKRLDPLYEVANPGATEPDLDRAMTFLKSCTVVGVTPQLRGFVRVAFPYFGVSHDEEVPYVNRRQDLESQPGFEPVTVETLCGEDEAAIAELTRNDRVLYEYALSVAPRS